MGNGARGPYEGRVAAVSYRVKNEAWLPHLDKEVDMICQFPHPIDNESLCDVRQAHYVIGTLNLLLDVVDRESVLGVLLEQTRTEIESLAEAEQAASERRTQRRLAA